MTSNTEEINEAAQMRTSTPGAGGAGSEVGLQLGKCSHLPANLQLNFRLKHSGEGFFFFFFAAKFSEHSVAKSTQNAPQCLKQHLGS